jgi:hypothetical protein
MLSTKLFGLRFTALGGCVVLLVNTANRPERRPARRHMEAQCCQIHMGPRKRVTATRAGGGDYD